MTASHMQKLPQKVLGMSISRSIALSGVKYVIVGGLTFLMNYALNWVLIEIVEVHYLYVGYIVTPIILLFNFSSHKLWSFRDVGLSKGMTGKQIVRYFVLVAVNSVVGMFLMYIFYGLLEIPLFPTMVICTAIGVAWNFPVFRFWVYRD